MGKNIINNEIKFEGNSKRVAEVLKEIEKNNLDFESYVSIGSQDPKMEMTDYINVCLRMYRDKFVEDKANFDKVIEFVCSVGTNPYDFNAIDEKTICAIKSQNQASKMLKDARSYISSIESKAIYNNLWVREVLWGCGTKAFNVKVKPKSVVFNTRFQAPKKIVAEIARRYHDLKVLYTYSSESGKTVIQYVNGMEIPTQVDECVTMDTRQVIDMYSTI